MSYEDEIETMEEMARRLGGCSSGAQAKVVIKAIKEIQSAPGQLDLTNSISALYWLAVALKGKDHAVELIVNAAYALEENEL